MWSCDLWFCIGLSVALLGNHNAQKKQVNDKSRSTSAFDKTHYCILHIHTGVAELSVCFHAITYVFFVFFAYNYRLLKSYNNILSIQHQESYCNNKRSSATPLHSWKGLICNCISDKFIPVSWRLWAVGKPVCVSWIRKAACITGSCRITDWLLVPYRDCTPPLPH